MDSPVTEGPGPQMRRTRFVCISDTHNASPEDGCFKLPPGDVLIHAGDLTNQGTFRELKKTVDWIAESDYEVKIVVAGNHDITLDREYYTEHWAKHHERYPQGSQECIDYISSRPGLIYLNHASTAVKLKKQGGPNTHFTVFGSPYSPRSGQWAFNYKPIEDSSSYRNLEKGNPWKDIPTNTDIIITHTPARGHCDAGQDRSCPALQDTLRCVRPRLAVCGHIHEGWGAEQVTWYSNNKSLDIQADVQKIQLDRVSKKLAKIDMTVKNRYGAAAARSNARLQSVHEVREPPVSRVTSHSHAPCARCPEQLHEDSVASPGDHIPTGSGRHEQLALEDQSPPYQTCIVNAAIMAKSRHAGRSSGPAYNKPIIVDIDLPVWHKTGAGVEQMPQ